MLQEDKEALERPAIVLGAGGDFSNAAR